MRGYKIASDVLKEVSYQGLLHEMIYNCIDLCHADDDVPDDLSYTIVAAVYIIKYESYSY